MSLNTGPRTGSIGEVHPRVTCLLKGRGKMCRQFRVKATFHSKLGEHFVLEFFPRPKMHWLQPDRKCKDVYWGGRGETSLARLPAPKKRIRVSLALSGEDGRFLAASLPRDLKYPDCLDLMSFHNPRS